MKVRDGEAVGHGMGGVLRYLLILAALAVVGGAIYAMVADLPPPTRAVDQDVPGARLRDAP